MHRIFTLASIGFACSALLTTTSCGGGTSHGGEQYYLLASNIKLPYWQAAAAGLNRATSDFKLAAEMVGPATYDRQEEKAELERLIARKPSGILVSAADPELLKDTINAGIAAGIPIITMDSDAPSSQRLMFIGTNNYQAGLMGGRVLAKQLQGKGSVVVFSIPGQANLEERLRGYRDALAATPQIDIVQVIDIRGDPAVAFDKTAEIIASGKLKAEAFVCLEATACKEVADVLSRKNITGKTVVAMDTDEGTLDWIERGGIAATISQRPYTMAYYGLKTLDDLHHHKLKQPLTTNWGQDLASPIPSMIDTGASLIDRSNVAETRSFAKAARSSAVK